MDAYEIVRHYGGWVYPITFLWTLLEGETFVIIGGFAASKGWVDLSLFTLVAWLGTFCADQIAFYVGRKLGPKVFDRSPALRPKVEKATVWVERNATLFILAFRFVYGVRNVAAIAIALSNITWARFALLNFIAAGVWAVVFVGIGYILGDAVRGMADEIGRTIGLTALGLFALLLLAGLIRRWWRGRATPPPAS